MFLAPARRASRHVSPRVPIQLHPPQSALPIPRSDAMKPALPALITTLMICLISAPVSAVLTEEEAGLPTAEALYGHDYCALRDTPPREWDDAKSKQAMAPFKVTPLNLTHEGPTAAQYAMALQHIETADGLMGDFLHDGVIQGEYPYPEIAAFSIEGPTQGAQLMLVDVGGAAVYLCGATGNCPGMVMELEGDRVISTHWATTQENGFCLRPSSDLQGLEILTTGTGGNDVYTVDMVRWSPNPPAKGVKEASRAP